MLSLESDMFDQKKKGSKAYKHISQSDKLYL